MNLLFIHGAGASKDKWRALAPYFKGRDADFIDLPGHGDNAEGLCHSIEEMAAWLQQKLKPETIVVGHAMGGLVALALAAKNPQVKGVVLASSFYELPVAHTLLESLSSRGCPDRVFDVAYADSAFPALLVQERAAWRATAPEVLATDLQVCAAHRTGKQNLTSLTVPVLALAGAQDRLLPENAAVALANAYCQTESQILFGVGHHAILEAPLACAQAIQTFAHSTRQKLKNQERRLCC
ncbi:MAG: alpha/beta fold hydrolase [Neisseriaceae bacterium]|nr:alpha/beta fold hydrolase [Neisseriaceae bacterium]MBP6862012.1 alpha/beta fold hydrolase [Neisseriaceae bacterium]